MALKLEGMPDLLRKLEQMNGNAPKIKEEALKEGAEVIRKKIEDETPKSEIQKKHGADNIIVTDVKDDVVEIGPHKDHWYLIFPEFGTKYQPPQGFTERAFNHSKDKALKTMAERIRKELEQ